MFTAFVTRSIIPTLMVLAGLAIGDIGLLLTVAGGIWIAINAAKLADAKSRHGLPHL